MDELEKLLKFKQNDGKTLTKFFKYTGKIKSANDLDEYLKINIKVPLLLWALETIILRAFLIFVVLECLPARILTPPQYIFLAEGISIAWFLLVELKREIWRKE